VIGDDDIGRRDADAAGQQIGRHFRAELQRLRRRDGRRAALDLDLDQACDLLEAELVAKGISLLRLKMRTRAVLALSAGGSTNVVSLRLNSAASDCISASVMPWASGKTASGLPPKRRSVKTSTVTKWKVRMRAF
jgi:hypothetical protein